MSGMERINTPLGSNTKQQEINVHDNLSFAKDLSVFETRLDNVWKEENLFFQSLPVGVHIDVTETDAFSSFRKINTRKVGDPDNITGIVL